MKNGKQIDQLRRNLLKNTEEKRSLLKAISKDSHLPWRDRQEAIIRLARLPRNGSKTRIRNRCILTGRTRSIQQPFKLSRISFRQLAARGLLPGVYKASW
jgi:small subunit ribosomal protein S14